jgi:phage terminase Nu1 subunit (DNA packaging protein)
MRLCWTRRQLVEATGLSYRSIQNLESRGLLLRVAVGLNVAVYSDASVQALFADKAVSEKQASVKTSPSGPEVNIAPHRENQF